MSKIEAEEYFTIGMEFLENRETGAALDYLEKAVALEKNPHYCSSLALCLANEKRDFKKAITLCHDAIKSDPKKSFHFLNLGRVYLLANQKKDAMRIFNIGLRYGGNRKIIAELRKFGKRRAPSIPFLVRNHLVNRVLGKLTHKLGIR